jgi:hypothetical protein
MCNLRLEVGWQIDDVDCAKRALLRADTTSYAEGLGYESDFRFWGDFDTETTTANNRARFLAFLPTFLFPPLVPCQYYVGNSSYLGLALFATEPN